MINLAACRTGAGGQYSARVELTVRANLQERSVPHASRTRPGAPQGSATTKPGPTPNSRHAMGSSDLPFRLFDDLSFVEVASNQLALPFVLHLAMHRRPCLSTSLRMHMATWPQLGLSRDGGARKSAGREVYGVCAGRVGVKILTPPAWWGGARGLGTFGWQVLREGRESAARHAAMCAQGTAEVVADVNAAFVHGCGARAARLRRQNGSSRGVRGHLASGKDRLARIRSGVAARTRHARVHMAAPAGLDALFAPSGVNAVLVHAPMYLWARNASSIERILTPAGLLHSTAFGVLLWSSMGARGWLLGVTFLVLGSVVTKLGLSTKQKEKTEQSRGGRRGPENVWGAAGGGALCALGVLAVSALGVSDLPGALHLDAKTLNVFVRAFELGFVCSMCSKLSDTVSSEIGKAYGKTTFLVTTFQPVPRGTEGAVSVEGTLAGIVASFFMAALGFGSGFIDSSDVVIAVAAAFVATTAESIIGASLQDSRGLSNELVNFIMTVIGAGVGVAAALVRGTM
ncbi:Protein VTE6, chloroplastic [Porphyridium purpureum]|uniref:Protein VTE6, chloroplastic n=1 Tax=Porphyridium purpureum TaxID=35688 RepID=A0A5J4YSJ5_PORPP|nr:Protein VTE6, chloroplastic [Porphyridium purpureum]|eukprot:POR5438..scf236_6